MRFSTYRAGSKTQLAVVDGDKLVDVVGTEGPFAGVLEPLATGVDLISLGKAALADASLPRTPVGSAPLAPAVLGPGKIICLGLNYSDHAKEGGNAMPDYPALFMRSASSLIGSGEAIIRPLVSTQLDYEAELAVIIGKKGRHIGRQDALAHVFGYSCFNDVSVRDYQRRTSQWTIGKNFDGTGSFGPAIVTTDELPAGASGLAIVSRLNGTVMQQSNTGLMVWNVANTISLLSEVLTLEPGDVLVMGTPAGVGYARTPPVWLTAGDLVEVEIEQIGTLSNRVADEARLPH